MRSLCHCFLEGEGAFDGVHDAAELGEDAIACGVDDAATVTADHRKHDSLMTFQVPDGRLFVRTHQRAVACNVSGEDGGQPALNLGVSGVLCRH